ncbi:MAG: hypothetical protein methR_P0826 [Methyloprofundus sp.]|nr:MAG: hypothetical protein methR_P0826 [Methyloprofundus sp.]
MSEENTTEVFEKLRSNMPSIGFINRKKRIKAYIEITKIAEFMLDNEEISAEEMLFVFSLLMRKYSPFQKSAMMTALSLDSLPKNILSPIGLKFVLEVRKNLSLPDTHHSAKNNNEDSAESKDD